MSIYTDMIEYIDKYGIARVQTYPDQNNKCCMLGVLSIVTGSEDPYEIEVNVDELVNLSRDGLFEEFGPSSLWTERNSSDDTWIYGYNDAIINGDKEKAIALLEKAEAIRKEN